MALSVYMSVPTLHHTVDSKHTKNGSKALKSSHAAAAFGVGHYHDDRYRWVGAAPNMLQILC
jgi:hypothetical protein